MSRAEGSEAHGRSIRATDEELQAILDRLDAAGRHPRSADRSDERFPYRVRSCSVKIVQPGVPPSPPFLAPTRNLSAGGMAFLHGAFVHNGVTCTIHLVTTDGHWIEIGGRVVRCRYIENWIHEVCVSFDHEIRPEDFCADARRLRILLVEPNETSAKLAAHHLALMMAEVHHVTDEEQALVALAEQRSHCIFLDTDHNQGEGLSLVSKFRARGFRGPIVALTDAPSPEDRQRCLEAGCGRYYIRPFAPDRLGALIDSLRAPPLRSTRPFDESTGAVAERFLADLPGSIRALEEALLGDDHATLAVAAGRLRDDAGGLGYEPIASAATALEALLEADAPVVSQVKDRTNEIIDLCLRARSAREEAESASADHAADPPGEGSSPPDDAPAEAEVAGAVDTPGEEEPPADTKG